MSASILLYGLDKSLLNTRGMVLERAGFRVLLAQTLCEVGRMACDGSVGLVILCHTLAPEQREQAMALVEERCPWAKSLLLASNFTTTMSAGGRCSVVPAGAGPQGLVMQVGRMLGPVGASH